MAKTKKRYLNKSEAEIQRDICEYLKDQKIPFSVTNASGGGKRRRCPVGIRRGWPDVTGCLPGGRFLAIEVKANKGRVSEDQEDCLCELKANGALVVVARNVNEVAQEIDEGKVMKRIASKCSQEKRPETKRRELKRKDSL